MRIAPLAVALALVTLARPAAADDKVARLSAPAVVKKVQAHYAAVKQLSAKFHQVSKNTTFDVTKSSFGEVFVLRPTLMRWDYYVEKKIGQFVVNKSFVSDGRHRIVVDHEHQEVFTLPAAGDLLAVAVAFVHGTGDLATTHRASLDASGTRGAAGDLVLALKPKKKKAGYKTLFLVVDPTTYEVKQSIVIDRIDNETAFELAAPDVDTAIDAGTFVVDLTAAPLKDYRRVEAEAP